VTLYQYPMIYAGTKLTGPVLQSIAYQYVEKGSDTTRASTTTLTDDPDLTVAVVANGIYLIEFGLDYDGLSAADFKTAWNTPAGVSGLKAVMGPGSASGDDANANNILGRFGAHGFSTSISYNCSRNSASATQWAIERSVITIGATPGNVTLQWAQVVSNATGNLLSASSWVRSARLA
jgi:hypothetical protein